MTRTLLVWAELLLLCSPSWAADVTITAPASVARGSFAIVMVSGVTPQELTNLINSQRLTVSPADGVFVVPMAGSPMFFVLISQEATPGKRTITIPASNGFVKPLLDSAAAAQGVASDVDAKKLLAIAQEVAGKYPYSPHAQAVLEVTGARPPPVDPVDPPVDPVDPVDPNRKVSRVTYVFEKDTNNPPRAVSLALQKLNQQSIIATEFEEDSTNAAGQVPTQYKIALEAARKAGLPALVVQAGDAVIRVVKSPTTEAQVLEAAKP